MTRREALTALAAAGGTVALGAAPAAPPAAGPAAPPLPGPPPPAPARRAPVPLPFDPRKLRGLSEKLLRSHWENNYGGALKNLDAARAELARLGADAPGFLVSSLRERELSFANSVALHELYFANLGGDGKPGGPIGKALGAGFGSLARFEETFRAAGTSLAGGCGWALLACDLLSGDLRLVSARDHTQALAAAHPLLVLDMYEHAYHLDHGAAAARYVEAFWANVRWEEVNRRWERAQAAAKALRA